MDKEFILLVGIGIIIMIMLCINVWYVNELYKVYDRTPTCAVSCKPTTEVKEINYVEVD